MHTVPTLPPSAWPLILALVMCFVVLGAGFIYAHRLDRRS